jgi:hypothetical protein
MKLVCYECAAGEHRELKLPYCLVLLTLLLSAAIAAEDGTSQAGPPLVAVDGAPSWEFPQRRETRGYSLLIHAPQVRSWTGFEQFEALSAVELTRPDGAAPVVGTISIKGATEIDRDARIVNVLNPVIDEAMFAGDASAETQQVVRELVATRAALQVPLDLFLASLADDVLSDPPPPGFSTTPPPIHVASKPTLLLFVNGPPVLSDVADSGLKLVVNANWPTFQDASGAGDYYLLYRDLWLSSDQLEGGWKRAKALPAGFGKLPADDEHAAVRSAVPLRKSELPTPQVIFSSRPAELIVTDGKPRLEAIPPAAGLQFVANTESPLFKLGPDWYFLVAGRWFTTTDLNNGPWRYSADLPAAFGQIPEDHAMAAVRASVPGTIEARMAALEALLPAKAEVPRDAAPPIEVSFAGEPRFELVPETNVARAVNTGFDILQYEDQFYLLYAGVWYHAGAPTGPWTPADLVPGAIYAIPPSSPAYHVTQVTVVESTPTTVVYSYPPSYSSGVYVVYGVPYYGTGWYYPPYAYGFYYPYRGSYGHGSWYNPVTGGYGSRSAWYGPYGGYSYAQGYNPRTGRYGYVETAWDGDEWASHGETYNPRTGVGTETDRYYNEDKNKSQMDRTVQRGDDWMQTQRNVDYDNRSMTTSRETSGGGSSEMTRTAGDGAISSSGTITAGDGRTASVEGERTLGGGSTTITGADGSMDMTTRRQDGRSVTGIEGSGGGQGVSMSGQGPGRTTIGQSGSGDLYAGHNGNVYKKSDDGWSHYNDGGWQSVDPPARPQGETGQQRDAARSREAAGSRDYAGNHDVSRLDRDYAARQRGTQQFGQRAGGFQRGGGFGGRGGGRGRR